jgi:hypothetical protein
MIIGDPVELIVASPGVAGVINCAADVLELHVTELVKSCVLLSEKVPVAVNWYVGVVALGIVLLAGVTAMLTSVRPTVTVAEPAVTPGEDACMVAVPATVVAVTSPFVGEVLLTVATPAGLLVATLQSAEFVRFFVLLSS